MAQSSALLTTRPRATTEGKSGREFAARNATCVNNPERLPGSSTETKEASSGCGGSTMP
jgi:hypothetical protein